MININKYNKLSDYLSDNNKISDESIVSQVDNCIVYRGVNVMLKADQLCDSNVCVVVIDNSNGELLFIPEETYQASKLDTSRYEVQDFILYGLSARKKLYMHKNNAGSFIWAEFNRYKLECDTTLRGRFSWAVTINGTAKSGSVSWEIGDTLDSIVAQLQEGAVATYLVFSHEEGDPFIRVKKGGYSNSTFTLSDDIGATLTDLSVYTKIDGVAQAETHRDWQSQSVATLFPGSGYLPASTVQYARNGFNLSYYCGANLAQFKSYFRNNGSAAWVAENSANRMKEAAFNSCADGTIGGEDGIALYNKYNGSWDAYMEAGMLKLNDIHRNGMEFKSYNNGVSQNGFLASVTTMDFDGSYIPAYPAANKSSLFSIQDKPGCLPTNHEIGVFMEDERFARINGALRAVGGTQLSKSGYYWGVAEYSANGAWYYNGNCGCVNYNYRCNGATVRPVLASA